MTTDKQTRQKAIRKIFSDSEISSQEELLSLLREMGFEATQATLSRDFKDLGVVKYHDSSLGYVYRMSAPAKENPAKSQPSSHPLPDFKSTGIRSIEFAGNMAVIKTLPGFAGAAASIIDSKIEGCIAGTIAGDDTVFLVIRDGYTRDHVRAAVLAAEQ